MKRVIIIPFVLLLSGCVGYAKKTDYEYEKLCEALAKKQNRSEEWKADCAEQKFAFDQGIRAEIAHFPDPAFCELSLAQYGKPPGAVANQIVMERHIDCKPTISKVVKEALAKAPTEQICVLWYLRKEHPLAMAEIDAHVESNLLDCEIPIRNFEELEKKGARKRHGTMMMVRHPRGTSCHTTGPSILCY